MKFLIHRTYFNCNMSAACDFLKDEVGGGVRKVYGLLEVEDCSSEEDPDGQAFTYVPEKPGGTILIEIYKCDDPLLALAHELVHAAQIVYRKSLCENEAYRLEAQVKEVLLK